MIFFLYWIALSEKKTRDCECYKCIERQVVGDNCSAAVVKNLLNWAIDFILDNFTLNLVAILTLLDQNV